MDVAALQSRANKARDQAAREKHALLATAWSAQQGVAMDRMVQRITLAREQLQSSTVAAADQGKDEVTLLRMSFQTQDLRQVIQDELHASQKRTPDTYPKLRSQGPPSFKDLENWLSKDLLVSNWEHQCPLPWLVELERWVKKTRKASMLTKLFSPRPKLPAPLQRLYDECKQRKLNPRFEPYRHREDQGIALVVRWRS